MAIKETEVEVIICGNNLDYYERLGYVLPRKLNKYRKITVPRGTKIVVKVQDLMPSSTVKVTKICDICEEGAEKPSHYHRILAHREGSGGLDTCRACGTEKRHKNYIKRNDCLIDTHPHIADMLVNKEEAYNCTPRSHKELAFRCDECDHEFNRIIFYATKTLSVLLCPRCSDGAKYPEKFFCSLLFQLGEEFEYHKMFPGWFIKDDEKVIKRLYDFYLKRSNSIIEVHGEQHFVESFKRLGGRTLKEEQENDRLKKEEALKPGRIDENRYIEIDAKISSLDYLKNSILNSWLNKLFDLSKVDWEKCHKDALKTIVKTACDEWNNGMSTKEISIKLGRGQKTVVKYLKQGAEIGWCDYDAKLEIYSRKAVVQLSLDGKHITEFISGSEAGREIGLSSSNISSACRGVCQQIGGYRWMFKEDYDNLTEEKKINLRNTKFEPPLNQKKEIYQLDENLNIINIFESFHEAKRQTGVSSIWEACNGKIMTAGGYKWRIKEDYENLTEEEKANLRSIKVIPKTQKKEVYQLDKNLNIINVFESSAEARRQTGARKIGEVCNGNRKFAGGYKWMFKEDYVKSQKHKWC